jgi:hypothetical protein
MPELLQVYKTIFKSRPTRQCQVQLTFDISDLLPMFGAIQLYQLRLFGNCPVVQTPLQV